MTAAQRAFDRGSRLGERVLHELGREFESARRGLGVSQEHVAAASHVSRPRYSRMEHGKVSTLQVVELTRIATVLGLDPSIRLFPGSAPVRDAGHALRLAMLLRLIEPPLKARTEVPLPQRLDRREQRSWDGIIDGSGDRTAVELEMRLHDTQALERRISLKRRDDPTGAFLLVIADTRTNRRVLAELPGLFPDLPRIPLSRVAAALTSGRHPATGLVLV